MAFFVRGHGMSAIYDVRIVDRENCFSRRKTARCKYAKAIDPRWADNYAGRHKGI
jgi:hypothetical protein